MKLEDLDKLDDAGLDKAIQDAQAIISKADRLIAERERKKQADVIAAVKAQLAEVGLSINDLKGGKSAKRNPRSLELLTGQVYVNPANTKQTYRAGRGRKPDWFKALEKAGKLPDPVKP